MSDKSDSTTGKSGPTGEKSPEAPGSAPSGENESKPTAGFPAASPGSGGQTTRPKRRLKITRALKRRDPPATIAAASPSGLEPEDQGVQPPIAAQAEPASQNRDSVPRESTASEAGAGDQTEEFAEAEFVEEAAAAPQVEVEPTGDPDQADSAAAGAESLSSVTEEEPLDASEPEAEDDHGDRARDVTTNRSDTGTWAALDVPAEPDAEAPAAWDHGEPPDDQEPDEQEDLALRGGAPESVAAPEDWGPDDRDAPATAQGAQDGLIGAAAGPDESPPHQGRQGPETSAKTDLGAMPDARGTTRARSFVPPAAAGKTPGKSRSFLFALILLLVLCLTLLALFAWLRPILMAPETENPASKELTVEELTEIEQLLSDLLIEPGPIDGAVDDQTREAIRFYQESGGLPVDGEPTAALLNDLREVAGGLGN